MKILIASLYKEADPIINIAVKYSTHKIIIFHQSEFKKETAKKEFKNAKTKLESFFKKPNFELSFAKVNEYDTINIAKKLIKTIETINKTDKIILNITGGRKTLSLGLLFGAYARPKLIKEIVYVIEETGKVINLPKLDFALNESEKKCLETIKKLEKQNFTITDFAKEVGLSRAMVYKILEELEYRGYIREEENKYIITTAGKIVLL